MGAVEQSVRDCLGRIRRDDAGLNAIIETLDDAAIARARSLDETGRAGSRMVDTAAGRASPLFGQPVLVKDNICTRAAHTTCASRILRGYRSPYSATAVERLEAAGAVVVGKTNLDEFAMGSSTENSAAGVTRNPWNRDRVAGGSSGGSAAAVAARLAPYALGSETGGSVRQPAAFCGITGLKPTYGRVSRYGLVAFASSLDQIGPMAVDAVGVARLLSVIAGPDPRDATSADVPVPDYEAILNEPIGRPRIGIAAEYFAEGLDPEVRQAVEAAIETYRSLGADICEISLPHARHTIACYYVICTAEASSNLARFDGVHYGHRTPEPRDYIEVYSKSRGEGFGPEVKRRIMLGTFVLSSGYYDAYYLKAMKVRTLIRRDFERAFESCDVILSPTTPAPAFCIGEKCVSPLAMYLQDIYTAGANLAGIPAISLPCGFSSEGLPIGLQLMAPHFEEARLLQLAHAYQSVTNHHAATPPA